MSSTIVSLALVFGAAVTAWGESGCTDPSHHHGLNGGGGRIVAPGPGYGWGFPNGNPDGYGWWDHGDALPLGADRTAEYYFPRYLSLPPTQMFLQSYYNPYLTRGQRYVSYSGCGGQHPVGGLPAASAMTPVHPYQDTIGTGPKVSIPTFSGRTEAAQMPPGGSGLTPEHV